MNDQEITNKRVERQAQSAISEMAMELAYLTATIDRHERENAELQEKVAALESANRLLARERVMGSERLERAERELAKAREDADAQKKRLLPYGWEVLAMARPLGTEMGLYDWTLRITKPNGQQVLVAVGESPSEPVKQAEEAVEVEVKAKPEPPRDHEDVLQWHFQRLKRESEEAMRSMIVPVVDQSVLEKAALLRAVSPTFGPWLDGYWKSKLPRNRSATVHVPDQVIGSVTGTHGDLSGSAPMPPVDSQSFGPWVDDHGMIKPPPEKL